MNSPPFSPFLAFRTIIESVCSEESTSAWGTNPPPATNEGHCSKRQVAFACLRKLRSLQSRPLTSDKPVWIGFGWSRIQEIHTRFNQQRAFIRTNLLFACCPPRIDATGGEHSLQADLGFSNLDG